MKLVWPPQGDRPSFVTFDLSLDKASVKKFLCGASQNWWLTNLPCQIGDSNLRPPQLWGGCPNWVHVCKPMNKKTHMLWKHPTSSSWISSLAGPPWQCSQKSMECPNGRFLTSWPWPLTYDLDLQTWPRYSSTWSPCQNSSLYVCPFGRESGNRHADTGDVKTITPDMSQTWGVMMNGSFATYVILDNMKFQWDWEGIMARSPPSFWHSVLASDHSTSNPVEDNQ